MGLGDAVLFKLSPHLVHRLTPIKGPHAKTAFAGWFHANPRYLFEKMKIPRVHSLRIRQNRKKLSLKLRASIHSDVVYRQDGSDKLVLNPRNGRVCRLNSIGSRIWELLDEKESLNTVFKSLLTEYKVPPHRLRRDLLSFAGILKAEDLLQKA